VVHVAGHERVGQSAAVPDVTVPVAAVVTVGGEPVAGHPVRQCAVSGQGTVPGEGAAVARQGAVTGYRTVTVPVPGVMGVRVRVSVVAGVNAAALFLFGYFLYGQKTVLSHLYPLGHVPHRRVFCGQSTAHISRTFIEYICTAVSEPEENVC